MAIPESLHRIQDARFRHLVAEMPAILRRTYEAEVAHSTSRADKTFICDGNQQDGLEWRHSERPDGRFWARIGNYGIVLTCSADASGFQTASSRGPVNRGPTFSINETGKLVVTERPAS